MEEEVLKLSDLRRRDVPRIDRSPTEFVTPANELDDIINNTSVEDTVTSQDGALFDGDLNTRIQRLGDLKNNFTLINRQFANAEENLIRETQGRGITQLGRRNDLITNQRILDSKRKTKLAQIEDLRGNVETAQRLRAEAAAASARTSEDRDRILGLSDEEILFEQAVNNSNNSAAAKKRILDIGYKSIKIGDEKYLRDNPVIAEIRKEVEAGLDTIAFYQNPDQSQVVNDRTGLPATAGIEKFGVNSVFGQNNILDGIVDFRPERDDDEEPANSGTLSIAEQALADEAGRSN